MRYLTPIKHLNRPGQGKFVTHMLTIYFLLYIVMNYMNRKTHGFHFNRLKPWSVFDDCFIWQMDVKLLPLIFVVNWASYPPECQITWAKRHRNLQNRFLTFSSGEHKIPATKTGISRSAQYCSRTVVRQAQFHRVTISAQVCNAGIWHSYIVMTCNTFRNLTILHKVCALIKQ